MMYSRRVIHRPSPCIINHYQYTLLLIYLTVVLTRDVLFRYVASDYSPVGSVVYDGAITAIK